MTVPVTIDVPHKLGQAGARERLKSRIGDLGGHMPAGIGQITHSWPSENVLALDISGMGQLIPVRLEIEESYVRVNVQLPAMLGFFAGMIGAAVRDQGTKLLA